MMTERTIPLLPDIGVPEVVRAIGGAGCTHPGDQPTPFSTQGPLHTWPMGCGQRPWARVEAFLPLIRAHKGPSRVGSRGVSWTKQEPQSRSLSSRRISCRSYQVGPTP